MAASTSISPGTVREAPARLLRFLDALSDPDLGAELAGGGLTDAHVDDAWALFDQLRRATRLARPRRNETAKAIAACEVWQATDLVRLRAIWSLYHREEAQTLFREMRPGREAAVLNAGTFLLRWGDREDEAMPRETLAQLRANVQRVQGGSRSPRNEVDCTSDERRLARDAIKRRMHAWVTAWSEVARTVVKRRDRLIRLGIATRRVPSQATGS